MVRSIFNQLFAFFLICLLLVFSGCGKKSEPELIRERGTVTDVQGNVYNTIKIGDQWWMTENLKVKVYNDSTPIWEVKSTDTDSAWGSRNDGAFCDLDKRYGLHYNWYAVSNSKKIAPIGWHIPGDDEWKTLETELGMSGEEADKTGWRGEEESAKLIPELSAGWPAGIVYGNNESGFQALPGGCRLFNGKKGEITVTAYWWSRTENGTSTAFYRNVSPFQERIFRYFADKNYGLTIRCVKD